MVKPDRRRGILRAARSRLATWRRDTSSAAPPPTFTYSETTDQVLARIREAQLTLDRLDHAHEAGEMDGAAYAIADRIKELDERLTAGDPLPSAWQRR